MRINGTKIKIEKVKGTYGFFNYAFTFEDTDKKIINEMIEWLSNNCAENFIVTETECCIVAGGWSDNKYAFKQGQFKITRKKKKENALPTTYEIRLDKSDIMHFRLRWIDESTLEE